MIKIRNNKYQSLFFIIVKDLIQFGKLPIFLFICTIITAMTTVTIVQCTRLLITKREQLVQEYDELDSEWRNLVLEENTLTDHSQIEQIAKKKLQLQHVSPSQEKIILQR